MPIYICEKCNRIFKKKYDYENHINRKFSCDQAEQIGSLNQIKGKKYEIFIKNFLVESNKSRFVWLWDDIPEEDLLNSRLITNMNEHRLDRKKRKLIKECKLCDNNKKCIGCIEKLNNLPDIGVDIVQKLNDDSYIFIQCKNYGNTNKITIKDLAGFYFRMCQHTEKYGIVYYTSQLSQNILENVTDLSKISYIKKSFDDKQIQNIDTKKQLYDYQINALDDLIIHFECENHGILNMPCGTGKTLIACEYAKFYDIVIIFSPLQQFAEQNQKRFLSQYSDFKSKIIDSENDRNINNIKLFIKTNNNYKILLSSTFKSADIIYQLLNYKYIQNKSIIFIIDEFHDLSKNNVVGIFNYINNDTDTIEYNNDPLYKILSNINNKILFMSATPRVYDLEGQFDDNEDTYNIFGELAHKMTFKYAIDKNIISDYRIYVPSVSEKVILNEIKENIYKEITDLSLIDSEMEPKCMFLYKCLSQGFKKTIVYFHCIEEINRFVQTFIILNEYYSIDINIDQITHSDKKEQRYKKIKSFIESTEKSILCSVHILDECIDIKQCDSIYITYKSENKIRNIQRICRSIRKDETNLNKISGIFLWCNTYDDLPEFISSIKEYDDYIKDKFKIIGCDYERNYNKKDKDYDEYDIQLLNRYTVNAVVYVNNTWYEKLEKVKQWIVDNNKRPNTRSKEQLEKQYGIWILTQQKNYKKQAQAMKDKDKRELWEEFIKENKEIMMDNDEKWYDIYEKVNQWIIDNNKRPNKRSKEQLEKQYGEWIVYQQKNYKKQAKAMKDEDKRERWEEFIKDNKELLMYNDEK